MLHEGLQDAVPVLTQGSEAMAGHRDLAILTFGAAKVADFDLVELDVVVVTTRCEVVF